MEGKQILIGTVLLIVAIYLFIEPSNERNWTPDQKVLSYAEVDDNKATIYNIRNFTYRTTNDYDIQYYNKTFDVGKIKNVYYIVEPFSNWKGAAHTFFSFEFEGNNFVAISVEIRKEAGEEFSAWKGLLKQYELMYVIGDERDLVKLRSNYRNDTVYVYPINTTKEKLQLLFLDMVARTNKLKENPEFYNTLTSTCTTNIVQHVNTISPGKIPFTWKMLAPGYSDKVVYDLGLIKTNTSFEETREMYKINERAKLFENASDFSIRIRS